MNGARRFLSIWLALLLCLSVLTPAALAEEEPAEAPETVGEAAPTEPAPPAETDPEPAAEPSPAEPIEVEAAVPDAEAEDEAEAPAEPTVSDGAAEEPPAVDAIELTLPGGTETYIPGGDDNDALFADYVEAVTSAALPGVVDGPALDGARLRAGDALTGTNKRIYSVLSERITAVAAGEITSTEFYISLSDLELKTTWSATELGLTQLISGGAITEEARQAYSDLVSFDLGLVVDALLADHPYELYWYDKTQATGTSSTPGCNVTSTTLTLVGGYLFYFPVASAYAADTYVTNGTGAAVTAAVARAQSIVEQYADVSDYHKLVAYRDEICALTSYNSAAAAGGGTTVPYGDPWQLIWIFDGDPDTTVVCEGYAKGFQYLCDLTSFTADISCISVTGLMRGGTGEGGHMWNIVTMDDGKNYLVDVTNCDSGTIGYPDLLFLRGCASGSVDGGYGYSFYGSSMEYIYDDDMTALFTADRLTLSATDYVYSGVSFAVSDTAGGIALTGAGVVEADILSGVDADTVVTLDRRATGVTPAAAAILSRARAVLILPVDAEGSCAGLLHALDAAGLENARVIGDADGDGETMADDLSRLLRLSGGTETTDELTELALDLNGDGCADIADAERIADFLVGRAALIGN